jgi:hypothetical protein
MKRILTLLSGSGRLNRTAFASIILLSWPGQIAARHLTPASAATKASACPSSGISSASGAINLTANCQVAGNITLSGTASLTMTGAVLTVKGNIVLGGQAQLLITNGGLTIPQTTDFQYSLTLNNSSQLQVQNSTFVTNGTTANNFSTTLNANNTSAVEFENSTLQVLGGSWLLGNFYDQSQLTVTGSTNLPTEIYPEDSSNVSVTNSNFAALWLDFLSGSNATINVPQYNKQGNFNFSFGNSPGFNYSVIMNASQCRLGLNSYPNSTMIVNGHGTSGANDVSLVFGYYVMNNTSPVSINSLTVGTSTTRQFTDQGRNLSLNHVNMNPLSWQVYVSQSNGYPVTVSNSEINEIAAFTDGLVNISNSTLQLATTGAVGPGSQMNIAGSQIWSSDILAENGGHTSITSSQIHGNYILATGSGSQVSMSSVTDDRNGSSSASCTTPVVLNGTPVCNPFNPLGQCATKNVQNGGTVTGTAACVP